MKKYTVTVPSSDSKNLLNTVVWEPDEGAKAVLQLVHGMAEHIERYSDFAEYLTNYGYIVIGHDHLGHGKTAKSKNDLGYFADENGDEIVIDDVYRVTQYARETWPELPNYILGHSMGSFFVRQYLTQYSSDVHGAIIVGTGWLPKVLADMGVMLAKREIKKHSPHYVSKMLVNMSIGQYNKAFQPARTPCDWLSRDMNNVDAYMDDPLCGFDFTAGAYKDLFTVIQKIASNNDLDGIRKRLPILITSGEEDPVGGTKACNKLINQYYMAGLQNSNLKLFAYDRHEILNEIDKSMIYLYIKNWLDNRVGEAEVYKNLSRISEYGE